MLRVPGGRFAMGERRADLTHPGDGDEPVEVEVGGFLLDATAVTNAAFAQFVDATGHVTDAERLRWSFVFAGLLPDDLPPTRAAVDAPWWRQVPGADWRHPEGPGSDLDGRWDHPVVHVSWRDAAAYCRWRGGRLPTEAEWERAARAGTSTTWWWGDEREPGGRHMMNVFQGVFPTRDTGDDGWVGTCPVDAYDPNPWGFSNMVGNVWEWTADPWDRSGAPGSAPGEPPVHRDWADLTAPRAARGGSYLCHASWCRRYRPSGRIGLAPASSAGHVGFRCAADHA